MVAWASRPATIWVNSSTDWAPGGDELTPTMKLKRRPIDEKYTDEIEELYA